MEAMMVDLDNQLLIGGSMAFRRLMLWHAAASLPETSSRRILLRSILLSLNSTGSGRR